MLSFKKALPEDADLATGMFMMLWPGHTFSELRQNIMGVISGKSTAVFIAYSDGVPAGAAECSLRYDYVEGTASSPVGYLEGIYVLPQFRRMKIASGLVRCCESWAQAHGCKEFASDCALDNTLSQQFHTGVGFTEAAKIVCFAKKLEICPAVSETELTFDKEMEPFFGTGNTHSAQPKTEEK